MTWLLAGLTVPEYLALPIWGPTVALDFVVNQVGWIPLGWLALAAFAPRWAVGGGKISAF